MLAQGRSIVTREMQREGQTGADALYPVDIGGVERASRS
jgi:hypothetical protein